MLIMMIIKPPLEVALYFISFAFFFSVPRPLSETLSYSAALSREIFDSLEVNFNLSGVIRTPSAMELFINGPHVATQRFERGNVNLRSEQSNNIDLSFVLEGGGVESTFTLFKNKVDDFIYLLDDKDADFSNGLLNATYRQRDAEFFGYELEVTKVVELERGQLSISLGRDQVSSKFRNGEYLPRDVPARNLLGIAYSAPGGLYSVFSVERSGGSR